MSIEKEGESEGEKQQLEEEGEGENEGKVVGDSEELEEKPVNEDNTEGEEEGESNEVGGTEEENVKSDGMVDGEDVEKNEKEEPNLDVGDGEIKSWGEEGAKDEDEEGIDQEEERDPPRRSSSQSSKRGRRKKKKRRKRKTSGDIIVKKFGNSKRKNHKFRKTQTMGPVEDTPAPSCYDAQRYFRFYHDLGKGFSFGTESRFKRSIYANKSKSKSKSKRKKSEEYTTENTMRVESTMSRKGIRFSKARRFKHLEGDGKPSPFAYHPNPAFGLKSHSSGNFTGAPRFTNFNTNRKGPGPCKYDPKLLKSFPAHEFSKAPRRGNFNRSDGAAPGDFDPEKSFGSLSTLKKLGRGSAAWPKAPRIPIARNSDVPGPGHYSVKPVRKEVHGYKMKPPENVTYYVISKRGVKSED